MALVSVQTVYLLLAYKPCTDIYAFRSICCTLLQGASACECCTGAPPANRSTGRTHMHHARRFEARHTIARTQEEYFSIAVALAHRPRVLQLLRAHLLHRNRMSPLFDCAKWVKGFERALSSIWEVQSASDDARSNGERSDTGFVQWGFVQVKESAKV